MITANFQWSENRNQAAILLAEGKTQRAVAKAVGITEKTLYNWLQHPEFAAEVDRLTLMTGIAARAERLRIAKRLVEQRVRDGRFIKSDKDLLDWLKFAQSETDGIKLDLTSLVAAQASLAGGGSDRIPEHAGDTERSNDPSD